MTVVSALTIAVAGSLGVFVAFGPGRGPMPADAERDAVGLWPERSLADVEAAQERVDRGEDPWRLDRQTVALRFASEILGAGWDDAVVTGNEPIFDDPSVPFDVIVETRAAPCPSPPAGEAIDPSCYPRRADVSLQQLASTGEGGIWTVVGVGAAQIDLGNVPSVLEGGDVIEATIDLPERATAALGLSTDDPSCPAASTASVMEPTPRETGTLRYRVPAKVLECAGGGVVYAYIVDTGPHPGYDVFPLEPFGSEERELLALAALPVTFVAPSPSPSPSDAATPEPTEAPRLHVAITVHPLVEASEALPTAVITIGDEKQVLCIESLRWTLSDGLTRRRRRDVRTAATRDSDGCRHRDRRLW